MTITHHSRGWTSDHEDASERAEQQAADRCTFQLTYARSTTNREFSRSELTGDPIPDAYAPTGLAASGEWMADEPWATSVPEFIDHYAAMAIAETIHEALEWFRVDDACWLDPHGPAEQDIYDLTADFARKLAVLRAHHQAVAEQHAAGAAP